MCVLRTRSTAVSYEFLYCIQKVMYSISKHKASIRHLVLRFNMHPLPQTPPAYGVRLRTHQLLLTSGTHSLTHTHTHTLVNTEAHACLMSCGWSSILTRLPPPVRRQAATSQSPSPPSLPPPPPSLPSLPSGQGKLPLLFRAVTNPSHQIRSPS